MARLLLVRHAPTPETGVRLTGRLPDVHLSAAGREAADRVARSVAAMRPTAIYASPIERTWETALAIGSATGLEPLPHPGIVEIDFGRWQGRTLRDLARLKGWERARRQPSRFRFPDGESFVEARARAVAACEGLASDHRRTTVVAVSHADVIKLILSHYLGQPLDLFQRIAIAPASISIIDLPPDGPPLVVGMNMREPWT